jgi:hypothetical protein
MPENTMTKDVNEHLIAVGLELAKAKIESETAFISHTMEDGRIFIRGIWNPLLEAVQEPLQTHSLQGIVDYLAHNPDALDMEKILVHVATPTDVFVRSTLFGAHRQRGEHVHAQATLPKHRFDVWATPDIFVSYLQSCFCDGGNLLDLIKIASHITGSTEVNLKDDGVSQQATLLTGIVRKGEVDVPNPVVLFPFSTFAEVEQPARKFVFRLKSEPINCILMEADGGAWKLTALERIAAWLRERVPANVKVIA